MRLSRVVFPAPRKPVRIVTGVRSGMAIDEWRTRHRAAISGLVAEVAMGREIIGDVVANGVLERGRRGVVAGVAHLRDVGAGVILILPADALGHFDELDLGRPVEGGKNRGAEVDPGAGNAG